MTRANDRKQPSQTRIAARVDESSVAAQLRAIRRLRIRLAEAGLEAGRRDVTAFTAAIAALEGALLADSDEATKATILAMTDDFVCGLTNVAEGKRWPRWTSVQTSLQTTERALRERMARELARTISAIERGADRAAG